MKVPDNNSGNSFEADKNLENIVSSASRLTPLDLNNIKLDDRHTVLTPDYLENLIKQGN